MQVPKNDVQDWHPADVVAALKKRQVSLRGLSIENGYSPTTLANALRMPWPKAEQIIAKALGERPEAIWPTRYARRNSKPYLATVVTA
nr:helix-turn-helix transcriptional regulator [Chitinimonas viridis]